MHTYKIILKNVDPTVAVQYVENSDSYEVEEFGKIGKCYVFGPNKKAHFKFDDVVSVSIDDEDTSSDD